MRVSAMVLLLVAAGAAAAAEPTLKEEMQREAGVVVDKTAFLSVKKGVGAVAGAPLGCNGQPVHVVQSAPQTDEDRRKDLLAVASRPGVLAYEGTSMSFVKDALLNVSKQAAQERYKMLRPDGSVKKTCTIDVVKLLK